MDPFTVLSTTILLLAVLCGFVCSSAFKEKQYVLPIAALFGLPFAVLMVEVFAYPTSLDGVTSLTGVFTAMFCVLWIPYWIIMAAIGAWRGRRQRA